MQDAAQTSRAPNARLSLALLLSINMINYIDRYNLSAVEQQVRDQFLPGDPDAKAKMGSLGTAFLITYMLMAPLFGWIADRTRRWVIIGIGVTLWSLATGACGLATSFSMLLACRVLIGVGEAAWGPTAPTLISDLYSVKKRGTVMAWFNIALSVGSALGFVLGGLLASKYGWKWAFLALAPPGLALGIWSFFMREPVRLVPAAGSGKRFDKAAIKTLFKTPSYIYNTIGATFQSFSIGGMAFWMVTYVHEFRMGGHPGEPTFDADHAGINLTFGAITASMGLISTLTGGYLADWLRPRLKGAYFIVSGASMLLAFPAFIIALNVKFPYAWVFIGLTVFLAFMNTGPTNTILANVTPARIRATAFALNILIIHALGDAIAFPVIGAITDRFHGNMNISFGVVAVAMALAGVSWLLGARHLEKDTIDESLPAPAEASSSVP